MDKSRKKGGPAMKNDPFALSLLFDYYGELLTEKQRTCFDLYYNQDLSLGEIAEEAGISRQGVHDSIARAETILRTMEEKTGCADRDLRCRRKLREISDLARGLLSGPQAEIGEKILALTDEMKE